MSYSKLKSYIFQYIGGNLSAKLAENYENIDTRHGRIIWRIGQAAFLVAASLFVLSAIFPISYALLNSPEPEHWTLPMSYR